jgi:hypothetical protein
MSEENIKVKVTCHEGFLVITTVKPKQDKNFFPSGGSKIGCVLIDTGKYLGMSHEAFKLMKTVQKSGDDIGEVDTWESVKGQCFSWLGPTKRMIDISNSETSRTGIIDIQYIPIENKVPLDAFEAIVRSKAESSKAESSKE